MADFNSKYSGAQVESLLDMVANGEAGGGGITEAYIADFTMESLRDGMNNGTNVDCNIQGLVTSMNANKVILVRENNDSSCKGVYILNGYAEDLLYFSIVDSDGNILWCEGTQYESQYIEGSVLHLRNFDDKQDTLVSGENIKTINGESIVGSGDITISGGSGEVGPQGPQGDKGDKGDTGVGVQSVKQTTTSNVDSGYNVVTVTLTDGTTSTFSVKNGSKGSTGANGTNGVSVSSVKQTTISSADGGTNVVTVTLSNGTTSTFNVKNGSKGSSGSNGTNGKDGADGEDGATFTPSVDSAGNLSWTNNKGLTNPPTVNIKGPKGDAGEGGGGSSGGEDNSVEELNLMGDADLVIPELLPNKKYVVWTSWVENNPSLTISSLGGNLSGEEPTIDSFYALIVTDTHDSLDFGTEVSLYLPDDGEWKWANGKVTQMKLGKTYEMSIIRHNDYGWPTYYITIAEY